ncbi:ABC transporter substrate-binding protein [Saliniradius amylolyticus]|nr:ABC transporter substrate-binding protein [Saliniradius amylolyticus]
MKFLLLILSLVSNALWATPDWAQIQQQARGQTVYFYAWGGSDAVNNYLRWASRELAKQDVRLRHVKVADISQALARLKAEGGRSSAIDLMWVNGENFHFLKQAGLLKPELWQRIPNARHLDTERLPLENDFGEPVDGLEVPWGLGQFNIIARQGLFKGQSMTPESLMAVAKTHPNQLSYPKPPEFHGTTFIKQLLVGLTDNDTRLHQPATAESQRALLPILWAYLDQLHPLLWQQGQAFPSGAAEQTRLLTQGELAMTVSFNPGQWQKQRRLGKLPRHSQQHYFTTGAITNSHYLAIPATAPNWQGAMVVIEFLLSQEAQRKKAQGNWGDPPVVTPLTEQTHLLPAARELHSSWQSVLEQQWQQRYGS